MKKWPRNQCNIIFQVVSIIFVMLYCKLKMFSSITISFSHYQTYFINLKYQPIEVFALKYKNVFNKFNCIRKQPEKIRWTGNLMLQEFFIFDNSIKLALKTTFSISYWMSQNDLTFHRCKRKSFYVENDKRIHSTCCWMSYFPSVFLTIEIIKKVKIIQLCDYHIPKNVCW